MTPFDRAFFDRWYRDPRHQVRNGGELARQATLAVAVAEYVLQRPIRRVLDIGAGEGAWRRALRTIRPRARYVGLEPSEYAVKRFGSRRGLQLGSVGALDELNGVERYDLVVCVDVLHYLDRSEVRRGMATLGKRLHGVALLQLFADHDVIDGDVRGLRRQPEAWYRRTFRAAGLTPIGLGYWVAAPLVDTLSAMELPDAPRTVRPRSR